MTYFSPELKHVLRELGISHDPKKPIATQRLTADGMHGHTLRVFRKVATEIPVVKAVRLVELNSPEDAAGKDAFLITKLSGRDHVMPVQIKSSPIGCRKFLDKLHRVYGIRYQDAPDFLARERFLLVRCDSEHHAMTCIRAQFGRMNLPCL